MNFAPMTYPDDACLVCAGEQGSAAVCRGNWKSAFIERFGVSGQADLGSKTVNDALGSTRIGQKARMTPCLHRPAGTNWET